MPDRACAYDGADNIASLTNGSEAPVSGTPVAFNLRFAGQYFDAETGLHDNGHRYYDPRSGRDLQSDPIGLAGGWNTYAYALSNPMRYTDFSGLAPR